MNFLDTGKEICFMGNPKTRVAPDLSIADMCALAWVRSNFPAEGGPEILQAVCEDAKITITLADQHEVVSFRFKTPLGATRAFNQLPQPTGYKNPYELAADVNQDELERMMNFGCVEKKEIKNNAVITLALA